ncbi:hypothetical protein [Falsigemmobacter faecalis]|uniref:hypothetical protein n=1 Tax=Falsigemmobacter faecalis TaxID=2488730 RepID=UPI0018F787A7|nr:hypothetical protein [Falsigemmobacter faecalis]
MEPEDYLWYKGARRQVSQVLRAAQGLPGTARLRNLKVAQAAPVFRQLSPENRMARPKSAFIGMVYLTYLWIFLAGNKAEW